MGAGLAKQIKEKYFDVYKVYQKTCQEEGFKSDKLLGTICGWTNPDTNQTIVNVFGQATYGRDPAVRYTSYDALDCAFQKLKAFAPFGATIAFPWNFGCGLANGKWPIVKQIIETHLGANFKIEYYTLDKTAFEYASDIQKFG